MTSLLPPSDALATPPAHPPPNLQQTEHEYIFHFHLKGFTLGTRFQTEEMGNWKWIAIGSTSKIHLASILQNTWTTSKSKLIFVVSDLSTKQFTETRFNYYFSAKQKNA